MSPYTKKHHRHALSHSDGWNIEDGNGHIIAILETETMCDILLMHLLGYYDDGESPTERSFAVNIPLGEDLREEDQP